ncbi:ExbD/TolR family protein [Gilvimarinus sp. F26214L]|uniref:ExbD/TolR family protein n=1 Tax=Gilvimarinus sp. DZF01 TaxID=3461371 RepID=UPI0040461324
MARRKVREEEESSVDLTPMLDVVFIMLIFFIVTSVFIKEAGIEVNRPDATTAQPKENVSILVAINANNEIWIDKRRVDVRAVKSVIERMRAENPEGGLVIQADNEANVKTLTAVADAARELGLYDVSIATDES